MLFKPLRGDSLFRASTSQSQFTKYIFGSEIDSHKLQFSIAKTLPSILPAPSSPLPSLASCIWKHCALVFSEMPPWGPELDGYSINQADSSCEAHGAKCSPLGTEQMRDIGSRWKEDQGGKDRTRRGGAELFSNLAIWSQRQANLFSLLQSEL